MQANLVLYGVPFSQPVRAVMWLLLMKRQAFELVPTNPGSKGANGSRHPDYLARNPGGTIPTLEVRDAGLAIGEAHAILCYLCNANGWPDLYPADPAARARVDWYLHYHHRNVREGSVGFVAPKIRKDLEFPPALLDASRRGFVRALGALDTGWLAQSRYLAGDGLTIADLAAYVEIGQLQPCFTNLFDFSPFANVERWLGDLRAAPAHDDVHVALSVLGDISDEAPDMDTIRDANRQAVAVLNERLAGLT